MDAAPGGFRVLVADDAAVIRVRMVALLAEIEGVTVVGETVDVPGTIESVRRLRPDVVILDLSIPGGSSLDVLHVIRAEDMTSIVIVLTNYADPESRQAALEAGASAFFCKSHEFTDAIRLIGELRSQRARCEQTTIHASSASPPFSGTWSAM